MNAPSSDPFALPPTAPNIAPAQSDASDSSFPLPPTGAPELSLTRRDSGFYLPDPTKKTSRTKVVLTPDTVVTARLISGPGLATYRVRNAVHSIAHDPSLIAGIDLSTPDNLARTLDESVEKIEKSTYAASARDWAVACNKWLDAYDHGVVTVDEVPAPFTTFVSDYAREIGDRGLTFVPELSGRYVVTGPDIISTTDRVYRDADGALVTLAFTTTMNLEVRLPQMLAHAGLLTTTSAEKILAPGGKGWADLPEDWAAARAGILHVPRETGEFHFMEIDTTLSTDFARTALVVHQNMALAESALIRDAFPLSEAATIRAKIRAAMAREDLSAIYHEYMTVWTQEYTDMGNQRLAEIGA